MRIYKRYKKKQVKFYSDLKKFNIKYKSYDFDIDNSKYNVVDENIVNELKEISEKKNRKFNEHYCYDALRVFTKINSFRRGNNKLPFENIRHIYITENSFAKYLAHNEKVKFGDYDIAFAKDIDFITSKFWFKLQKGFNNKNDLPKSFDVVTKAKIIISSHITSSLTKEYEKLHSNFKNGELTEEEASHLNIAYKEKPDTPEKITFENIDSSLDFLFNSEIQENVLREKTRNEELLNETVEKNDTLTKKIKEYELKEFEKLRINFSESEWTKHRAIKFSELRYYFLVLLFTIIPIGVGIILKGVKPLNDWILGLGDKQYYVWGGLFLLFVIEVQGRSYLFNKDKIKKGWKWLKTLLSFNYTNYKKECLKKFKIDF